MSVFVGSLILQAAIMADPSVSAEDKKMLEVVEKAAVVASTASTASVVAAAVVAATVALLSL